MRTERTSNPEMAVMMALAMGAGGSTHRSGRSESMHIQVHDDSIIKQNLKKSEAIVTKNNIP